MPEKYQGVGYALLYPETWKLEEEEGTMMLESPTGAFLSVSTSQDLDQEFAAVVQAMEDEYDEVESEDYENELGGQTVRGLTQHFVYLDLIVTCHVLKIESKGVQLVIQIQAEDRELEKLAPVFDAILTSLCQSLTRPD